MGQTIRKRTVWAGKLLALAILATAVLAAYWLGSRIKRPKTDLLRLLPSSADFGEVWETDAFRWEFVLQNSSDQEMLVRKVRPGCGCTRLERDGEAKLQPGEEVCYPLVVDLRQIQAYDASDIRSAEIMMTGEVGCADGRFFPFRCVAKGRVHRLLSCLPQAVGLGEQLTCGQQGAPIEIRLRTNRPLNEPRLKRVPKGWWAKIDREAKGQSLYVLRVIPRKEEPGLFADEVELEVVEEGGRVFPVQPIRVLGNVTDIIQVLPWCPDLGEMKLGTKARTSIWVSRKDEDPIQEVEPVSGDLAMQVLGAYAEGERWRIDLECTSDEPGKRTARGTVRVKSRRAPQGKAGFQVRWYGTRE
jgi:hypothetical protein